MSTARCYAFRDIAPKAPTHVLVVPRRHIANIDELAVDDAEHLADLADMLGVARAVARAEGLVSAGVDPDTRGGYRLVFNVGRDGGNTVGHLHVHVMGGRPMRWPPG